MSDHDPTITRLPPEPRREYAITRMLPSNAAVAKLTFEQRCGLVALYVEGHPATKVAAFGQVHVATMRAMVKKSSPHYRSVRAEFEKLGMYPFVEKYLTPELKARFTEWYNKDLKVDAQSDNPDKPGYAPDKAMRGKQGLHREADYEGTMREFSVRWVDEGEARPGKENAASADVGWHVFYIDIVFNDEECQGPFGTSRAAWNHWFSLHNVDKYVEPDYEKERARKRRSAEQAS